MNGDLLATTGAETVTIQGNRLGDITSTITATYGSTGIEYAASVCIVSIANSEIQCTSSEGKLSTVARHY